jgi:Flp pilus assembly protein TadG
MNILRQAIASNKGTAVIEMALTLPVLLLFIYGIFQYGVILQANAGMQHALGEGARYATIYPKPSDTAIVTRMQDKLVGMNVGTFGTPSISTPATSVCTNCRLLTVTYTVTPSFLFFNGPAISLTRTKQVYTVS